MANSGYRIRMKRGHSRRLRFWFAPVSERIMNADADWLEDAELSVDSICCKELFFPFIEKYLPDKFLWHNELNLMPFGNVLDMVKEVRRVASMMKKNYNDPRLLPYKSHIALDLLMSSEEYEARYSASPEAEKQRAIEEHIGVAIEFYERLCKWLEDTVRRYEPLGFNAIAIFAPR